MSETFDVVVVGAGPGGYVTAIRAAQLGFKTAVVEREHLGGICLNWGCIPTKALLRSAEIYHYATHAKDYGLRLDGTITPDAGAVVKRSRRVAGQLSNGVAFLMKKNKVSVIWGEAVIDQAPSGTSAGRITVRTPQKPPMQPAGGPPKGVLGPGSYQARHIIIATGARPRVLPGLEPDVKLVCTYYEAMIADAIPKSLLVVVSGAFGI
jgi:dihydrolipoamide dehydrogenase